MRRKLASSWKKFAGETGSAACVVAKLIFAQSKAMPNPLVTGFGDVGIATNNLP